MKKNALISYSKALLEKVPPHQNEGEPQTRDDNILWLYYGRYGWRQQIIADSLTEKAVTVAVRCSPGNSSIQLKPTDTDE